MIFRKPFYIMRHGQTTDNALGLISGAGSDPHLTDLGREQAKRAQALFSKLPVIPSKIIVSGLRRTHQTAEIVVGHLEFIIDADLNERHLGDLDGKITEAEQKIKAPLPGEESSEEHFNRVIKSMARHLQDDDMALFICHGGTVRRILEALDLKDKVSVGNAEIYCLTPLENDWSITVLGND